MKIDPGYGRILKTAVLLTVGGWFITRLSDVINGWELYLAGWAIVFFAIFFANPVRSFREAIKERDRKTVVYFIGVSVVALIFTVVTVSSWV